MVAPYRRLLLSLVFTAVATAAAASDYVVVRSSDPAILRGQGFDAGARLSLGPGGVITLMHASGDLVTVRGAAGGVSLPRRAITPNDAERMAVLRFILAPAPREGSGRPTRARSGICPPVDALTTLDQIVQVQQGGCSNEAAQALEAYIKSHGDAAP